MNLLAYDFPLKGLTETHATPIILCWARFHQEESHSNVLSPFTQVGKVKWGKCDAKMKS